MTQQHLTESQRTATVRKIVRLEGRGRLELLEECVDDHIAACGCTNRNCNHISYREVDVTDDECPKCGTPTLISIMELVGF